MPEERVPPGGHTTFAFGDEGVPPKTGVSANRYAHGNRENVMTGFPTTRIQAPPGGASTIIFDDGPASPPRKQAKRHPPTGHPPLPPDEERIQRGQVPTGGKQSYKFGTPSPMPNAVRQQATYEQRFKFGESATPLPEDYEETAPPVGGKAEICLGTSGPSPADPRRREAPAWSSGKSPEAAGKVLNTRCHVGQTSLNLTPTPQRECERLPPGGKQHNIFNRQSLANDPRMFPLSGEKDPLNSGRVPPGGQQSKIFFGEDNEKPSGGKMKNITNSTPPPRVLEEKVDQMRQRAPPGGASTISLG